MVELGSHVPNETLEPTTIRVYEIRVFSHHTPLTIILLYACQYWKGFDSSNVSLRKYFHHLATDMHQLLYPNLFAEGSALVIVSKHFYCFLASTVCQGIESDDVLQTLIWEVANRLTSPLLESLPFDSVHSWESKESDLLNCQSINIREFNPIKNMFTNNDNHMHSPTNIAKIPIFYVLSFEG